MIQLTGKDTKIGRALMVVRLLEQMLPDKAGSEVCLEAYANGREHGFALRLVTRAIGRPEKSINFWAWIFAESRNSDALVVYRTIWPDMQGNIPTEDEYNRRRFFETEREAAECIVKEVTELLP